MDILKQIKDLEQELLDAMQQSDVQKLDELILDELIFTDHKGQVFTKAMDLEAHRSGAIKVESLEPSQQKIHVYDNTAVVSVLLHITGKYMGDAFAGSNRYTRIWVQTNEGWKIAAAHASFMS